MNPNGDAIQYGMFIMPFHNPAKPLAQCHDEDLELVVLAEELGFSEFWVGEHHTMKYETVVMPEIFIARALGETKRIRLGPAPVCLNQHHPAHVAARLAFLDHLSHGRLNLALGIGSVTADHELYGLDPKDAGLMMDEAMEIILRLWSSDPPYEIQGKFWNISLKKYVDEEVGIGYIPRPLQQPHPPVAVPAVTGTSFCAQIAARRGFSPFASPLMAANVVGQMFQTYERAAHEAGRQPDRSNYRVARSIFLADTTREARALARKNSVGQCHEYIGGLLSKGLGRKILKRDPNMPDSECNLDYMMDEQIIAGDVDEVLRRLLQVREETGDFGRLVAMSYDWDDKPSWIRSTELFARELMPALNKAVYGVPVPAAR